MVHTIYNVSIHFITVFITDTNYVEFLADFCISVLEISITEHIASGIFSDVCRGMGWYMEVDVKIIKMIETERTEVIISTKKEINVLI